MNLTRCTQGHFYDGEKYPSCPHCGGAEGMMDTMTEMFTDGADMVTEADQSFQRTDSNPDPVRTQAATVDYQKDDTLPVGGIPADSVTIPISGNSDIGQTEPWNQEIKNDDDDDHTLAFFDYDESTFGSTPQAKQPAKVQNQIFDGPCVGWLVSIGGNHMGQDFHLKVGKNFIGRDESMDIALTGDRSVSREKQAIIIYEPKQHLYLVQPGEASSLVYCNNQVVLNPVQLKAYDMITVGEVNLIFIPLCGEKFNWNEILNSRKEK